MVVSTERTHFPTKIPYRNLMMTLGQRVATPRCYDEWDRYGEASGGLWDRFEKEDLLVPRDVDQPCRTDLEYQKTANREPVLFIPVTIR